MVSPSSQKTENPTLKQMTQTNSNNLKYQQNQFKTIYPSNFSEKNLLCLVSVSTLVFKEAFSAIKKKIVSFRK